jgi:hypothetical protein
MGNDKDSDSKSEQTASESGKQTQPAEGGQTRPAEGDDIYEGSASPPEGPERPTFVTPEKPTGTGGNEGNGGSDGNGGSSGGGGGGDSD